MRNNSVCSSGFVGERVEATDGFMTDYVAESSVGWLDHSAKGSQRMRGLISAFGDRQSVDNLGIGIVRDLINEQLFTGIHMSRRHPTWNCPVVSVRRAARW